MVTQGSFEYIGKESITLKAQIFSLWVVGGDLRVPQLKQSKHHQQASGGRRWKKWFCDQRTNTTGHNTAWLVIGFNFHQEGNEKQLSSLTEHVQ